MLPNLGTLSYNGVVWDALYHSSLSGVYVQDDAKRTTKWVEYTLKVDGVVTLPGGGAISTDAVMAQIRQLLSKHAAPLIYVGNGAGGLRVNVPGSTVKDLAWGPVPKVISITPLGAGRSVGMEWEVVTRIPEQPGANSLRHRFVLQYNYDAEVTYDDEGYSSLRISGVVEIPLTRETVGNRRMPAALVDTYRRDWMNIQIDLTNFYIKSRSFHTSRDKRTCDWSFVAEELPPMGLPPRATKARGTMSVKPMSRRASGNILPTNGNIWSTTLTATYTIRKDFGREEAMRAFYSLMRFRRASAARGTYPDVTQVPGPQPPRPNFFAALLGVNNATLVALPGSNAVPFFGQAQVGTVAQTVNRPGRTILVDFGFTEGIYLGSREMTITVAWTLYCSMATLLEGSGVWRWQTGTVGGNEWATSVRDIMGWTSWLNNLLDPEQDVIVDFGGGRPAVNPIAGPL